MMRMIFGIFVFFLMTTAGYCQDSEQTLTPAPVSINGQDSRWQTIKLLSRDGITINLKYLPHASLADTEWIGFEIDNVSGKKFFIGEGFMGVQKDYVLMGEYSTLEGKTSEPFVLSRGQIIPKSFRGIIPAGISKNMETSSWDGARLLRWTESAKKVHVSFSGEIDDPEGNVILKVDSSAPINFDFIWEPVPEEKFEFVVKKVHGLLMQKSRYTVQDALLLDELLSINFVGEKFSTKNLIDALSETHDDYGKTSTILKYLARKRGNETTVSNSFRNITDSDTTYDINRVLDELLKESSDYCLFVLEAMEQNSSLASIYFAESIAWSCKSLPPDTFIEERLVKALDARYYFSSPPQHGVNTRGIDNREEFFYAVQILGKIKHKSAISMLQPSLIDCSLVSPKVVYDEKGEPTQSCCCGPFPVRMCDAATLAILDIEGNAFSWQKQKMKIPSKTSTQEAMDQIREDMKKRLAVNSPKNAEASK